MRKEEFDLYFRDRHFVGTAVRSKEIVYLLNQRHYELDEGSDPPEDFDIEKKVINVPTDLTRTEWFSAGVLTQFDIMNIAVAQLPKPHCVAVDFGGQVYARGSGYSEVEGRVALDDIKGPQRGGMLKLRSIDGQVYSVGNKRSVCRREGLNHWVPLWGDSLPLPKVRDIPDFNQFGFKDIDGFSAQDIYAVGGSGDVWQYDGQRWRQIPFPSNQRLYNVCCGGDGQVYVAGHSTVFRGRGNKWQELKGVVGGRMHDTVWHQDRLWCTNDNGIWTITDGKIALHELPQGICSCMGWASAADGIMVMAGMYGAALHDGKQWSNLVDLTALYRQHGTR